MQRDVEGVHRARVWGRQPSAGFRDSAPVGVQVAKPLVRGPGNEACYRSGSNLIIEVNFKSSQAVLKLIQILGLN